MSTCLGRGVGIRQRLGLPSRRWGARSRSPRTPREPEPCPDPPPAEGQPIDPAKVFRNYISELFMENSMPGTTAQQKFQRASGAGARGSEDLGRCGASGRIKRIVHRDLMRRIMKGCPFPEECCAYVPVFNNATRKLRKCHCLLCYHVKRWRTSLQRMSPCWRLGQPHLDIQSSALLRNGVLVWEWTWTR